MCPEQVKGMIIIWVHFRNSRVPVRMLGKDTHIGTYVHYTVGSI